MPDDQTDIENFSPYKLIENFTKGRAVLCLVVALVLHVIVIGGTSVPYIYSTWISPQEALDADGQAPGAATRPTTTSAPARGRGRGGGRKSRVERSVTEAAKPEDMPKLKPKLDIPID